MLLTNEVIIRLNPLKFNNSRIAAGLISVGIITSAILLGCQIQSQQNDRPTIIAAQSGPNSTAGEMGATLLSPTVNNSNLPTAGQTAPAISPTATTINLGSVGTFHKWSMVEISFSGPESVGFGPDSTPSKIEVDVTFQSPDGNLFIVPAFYDGDGSGGMDGNIWKVRFNPDSTGDWRFDVSSSDIQLNSYAGGFEVLSSAECDDPNNLSLDLNCFGRLEYVGGHYLKFQNGDYWIKGGVDDPENFIGKAFGDWEAKKAAIDFLSSKGVNSIYVITNNIDGDRNDTWPWVGDTPQQAKANSDSFNFAKLQEWEDFFSYVQSKGIVLHIILNDDSAWTGYDHDLYLREMIARFGHHPGLIWNVGEEANEVYSTGEQESLARKIQQIDSYNHPVTVHRKSPWPFTGNKFFDLTSIQIGDGSKDFTTARLSDYNSIVTDHREKSTGVCHSIPVMIDETPRITLVNNETQTKLRTKVLYPIFFGGGNYELHYQDAYGQDGSVTIQNLEPMLVDMYRARQFIESLPFSEMKPCNGLLTSQNNYCFGKSGEVYAIYFPAGGSDSVDLSKVQGNFDVYWFNPRNGDKTQMSSVTGGGKRAFTTPDNKDWVLHLENPQGQVQGSQPFQNGNVIHVSWLDSAYISNIFLPAVMDCDG